MSRTAGLGTRVGPYDSSRPLRQDGPCWAAIRSVQGFLLTSHLWLCEHFISLAAPPALPEADLINLVADWHKWRAIAFLITEDPSLPAPLQTKCRDLWCCRIRVHLERDDTSVVVGYEGGRFLMAHGAASLCLRN